MELKYQLGEILTNKDVVTTWGSEKQIEKYLKSNKLLSLTKKSLIKEAERNYELREFKIGREVRYEIMKVLEEKQPKKDGRVKDNIYADALELLILCELSNRKETVMYFTSSALYEPLGFFNEKFKELNSMDNKNICDSLGVDYLVLKSFKITSKAEANRIINRVLKSMRNRALLDYIEGRIIIGEDGEARVASIEEYKLLVKLENEAMNELGCRSFTQLEYKNLKQKYSILLKEKVDNNKELKNIDYSYNGYCVMSHKKIILNEIKLKEKSEQFIALKSLFKSKLQKTFVSKHNYSIKKGEEETAFGESMKIGEASTTYLNQTNELIKIYT